MIGEASRRTGAQAYIREPNDRGDPSCSIVAELCHVPIVVRQLYQLATRVVSNRRDLVSGIGESVQVAIGVISDFVLAPGRSHRGAHTS